MTALIVRAIGRALDGHDLSRAEMAEVCGQIMDGEATSFVLRFDGRKIRIQRGFDVNDDIATLRHVHDHVGPDRTGLRRLMVLLGEIDMGCHARQLHQPL